MREPVPKINPAPKINRERDATSGKFLRGPGRPPGSGNGEYHKTRVTSFKKILPQLLARVADPAFPLDELAPLEIAAREFRHGLLADLGGIAQCTHAQVALVSTLTGSWVLLSSIDGYMMELAKKEVRGLLDRKRRRVASAVEQRSRMAESFCLQLRALHAFAIEKRRVPLPSIDELLRSREPDPAATNGNGHA